MKPKRSVWGRAQIGVFDDLKVAALRCGRFAETIGRSPTRPRHDPQDCDIAAAAPITPARIEERLRKALAQRAALKTERRMAEIVAWRSSKTIGIIGGIGGIGSEPPADGAHGLVAHAAEALSWLSWLEPDDAALLRARLAGAPWKSICWRFRISRPTADRRWRYALALIAWRLNGHACAERTPSLRCLLGMRRRLP